MLVRNPLYQQLAFLFLVEFLVHGFFGLAIEADFVRPPESARRVQEEQQAGAEDESGYLFLSFLNPVAQSTRIGNKPPDAA